MEAGSGRVRTGLGEVGLERARLGLLERWIGDLFVFSTLFVCRVKQNGVREKRELGGRRISEEVDIFVFECAGLVA